MTKKITLNHLLQYHYDELSLIDRIAVEHEIETNEQFSSESKSIASMKRLLNLESGKPSSSSIRIILDHNRKSRGELEMC